MAATRWKLLSAAAVLVGLSGQALGAPADAVRERVAGYKALGETFKRMNDALRRNPDVAQLRRAAVQISQSARQQYGWFPRGSGPGAGIRTDARPEIWSRRTEFRAAQDRFASQAAALQRATASGDLTAIRSEARKLGGTCKGCHDTFRAE